MQSIQQCQRWHKGEWQEATELGEVAEGKRERPWVILLGTGEPLYQPEGVTSPVLVTNTAVLETAMVPS